MTARLPLVMQPSGSLIYQLQTGTPDYFDGADTFNFLAGGRLTLTSNTPVTTSDVTSATGTIYYTPYLHDRISLWNGSRWTTYKFSQLTDTTLSGGAANQIYDYFIDWNGGSPILSAETGGTSGLWTNNTTRAHSLSVLNGVLVNSGNNARYVGSVRLSANGTLTDSAAQRFVWNYHNRVVRGISNTVTSAHTYGSTTWREWNGSTTNIAEFIIGENEDAINVVLRGDVQLPAVLQEYTALTGVGLDSTTSPTVSTGVITPGSTVAASDWLSTAGVTIPPATVSTIGYHYLAALESGSTAGSNTVTFNSFTIAASLPM